MHTLGPWNIAFEPNKAIVIGTSKHSVACIPNDGGKREKVRLDNARLICKAPEMYALLEALFERPIDECLARAITVMAYIDGEPHA